MRPDRGLRKPTEYQTLVAGGSAEQRLKANLLADQPGIEGYLTLTYVLADRGLFFLPGAFKKTAKEQIDHTFHLWQHWPDLVLGKHVAAEEDEKGFRVAVQLNEDKDLGREIMSDYRFGIPYAWSVGFTAIRDRSGRESDEAKLDRRAVPQLKGIPITDLRAIEEARWFEGSTVTWGSLENAGPDVVQAREFEADMVSTLLDALTNDTATPGQLANAERIADAWRDRAAAGEQTLHHGTRHEGEGNADEAPTEQTPRRSLMEIRAAQARITALVARGQAA